MEVFKTPKKMTDIKYKKEKEFSGRLDKNDDLASFRDEFVIEDPDLIYLDGNSLGRLPSRTEKQMQQMITEGWGKDLIRGWNKDWYDAPGRIGDKIAGLIGAAPGEVIVSDSTSVNLFKLVMAVLNLKKDRNIIVSDELNFPTDIYILQGCKRLLGDRHTICMVSSQDGITVDNRSLYDAINEQTALVTLSHVVFKSGFLYNAAEITKYARQAGALVLWDLSHSVGVVPIELNSWGVDMAVGCTYKYMNGGPGSPAFLYVRKDLQKQLFNPVCGWFGQKNPFQFKLNYEPARDVRKFLTGTPPILSLFALEPAVEILHKAGIERIRSKSLQLSSYLIFLVDKILSPLGFTLGTPRNPEQRGSHVSIKHPEGYRINRALIEEMNVLPDFREPDNIRLGLAPLYTTFTEVWEAVDRIKCVVTERKYEKYSQKRKLVT